MQPCFRIFVDYHVARYFLGDVGGLIQQIGEERAAVRVVGEPGA
jgi:hypothetical protein